jgi:hypothetical protein
MDPLPRLLRPLSMVRSRSRVLALAVALPLLAQTGCGTLLYPERHGQSSGRIDPAIAIMNGIGLLFFIIPGLIAFAIDFSTGAIYLPSDDTAIASEPTAQLDPCELTPERIEEVIRQHTGLEVSLSDETLRVMSSDPRRGELRATAN